MTAKKDLKRRVRDRQARTGESYAAARANVVGDKKEPEPASASAIDVEEIVDLTPEAAPLGIKCRVGMSHRLANRVDARAVLVRVRDALLATEDDAAMRTLRGVVLRGEAPAIPSITSRRPHDWYGQARRFVARALAGIGGVSEYGNALAMQAEGVMIICHVWMRPFGWDEEPPRLFISSPERFGSGTPESIWTLLR